MLEISCGYSGGRWLRSSQLMRVAAAVAIVSPTPSLTSQRVLRVTDQVSCPQCRIELDRRVVIQAPAEGLPGFPADFAMDAHGRIYLGFGNPPELMRFSQTGVFQQKWTRSGEGPGEARMIRYVQVIEGDSVLVYDATLQRASLFSPAGEFARAFRSPSGMSRPIQVGDGRFVINELIGEPQRVGLPFHEFLRTGLIGRSFGSREANVRPTESFRLKRVAAPSRAYPGDHFWAADAYGRYVIELRRVGVDAPVLTIERPVSWFPAPAETGFERPSIDRPPLSRIWGLWEDGDGLLWVLVRVADRRWRSAVAADAGRGEPGAPSRGSPGIRITNPGHYTDFRFEVIDPRRGRLVASLQVDEAFSIGSTPGVLIGYAQATDQDDPQWAVITPRVTGIANP